MQAKLQAQLNRQLHRDSSLSLADFDVLVALTDRPTQKIRVLALAESLQWEKSRLSHHLARMQRRGLITREDCPDDARGAYVVLAPAGRDAIESAAPGHVAYVRSVMFDGLDGAQVDVLAAVTEIVIDRIDGLTGEP
jgi:DNA-binding MarR family transcriptional regulator